MKDTIKCPFKAIIKGNDVHMTFISTEISFMRNLMPFLTQKTKLSSDVIIELNE